LEETARLFHRFSNFYQKIVYDSPTKTKAELVFSLEQGVYVNADNLAEIERIAQVIWFSLLTARSLTPRKSLIP
jgi:diaminopimelate decarboxylase